MDKLIPDPPHEPTTPLEEAIRADDLVKNREAIKRALDFYLCPRNVKKPPPTQHDVPHPPENRYGKPARPRLRIPWPSANTLAANFADQLSRPERNTALAIQQIIMLAELAVNRALDRVDPQA